MNVLNCVHPYVRGNFSKKACMFLPAVIHNYQKRISGPIMDGSDFHVEIPEYSN
jgi:predicted ATPase with chaperone activity